MSKTVKSKSKGNGHKYTEREKRAIKLAIFKVVTDEKWTMDDIEIAKALSDEYPDITEKNVYYYRHLAGIASWKERARMRQSALHAGRYASK